VVFLYRVKPGPASQSYGVQVARLAGIPPTVIDDAHEKLTELESHYRDVPFDPQQQLDFDVHNETNGTNGAKKVIRQLDELDVDKLTPKAALDLLYELKSRLSKD